MTTTDFAEFNPESWQEDGLLLAAPQPRTKWLSKRATPMAGAFLLGATGVLSSATFYIPTHGDAASVAMRDAPFEPAEQMHDTDVVSANYWTDLRRVVARWPTMPELDEDESLSEPII
jgi:hypothetical protein